MRVSINLVNKKIFQHPFDTTYYPSDDFGSAANDKYMLWDHFCAIEELKELGDSPYFSRIKILEINGIFILKNC